MCNACGLYTKLHGVSPGLISNSIAMYILFFLIILLVIIIIIIIIVNQCKGDNKWSVKTDAAGTSAACHEEGGNSDKKKKT